MKPIYVIVDPKLYNNAIQEKISDTSKFEKLNKDPTLKREASVQPFLRKLKHKNFFNENEYDKLYPSGSAPTRISCAQPEIFQGRGGFVKLGHFDKHFIKTLGKQAPQGKILEFFLLDTLKITF